MNVSLCTVTHLRTPPVHSKPSHMQRTQIQKHIPINTYPHIPTQARGALYECATAVVRLEQHLYDEWQHKHVPSALSDWHQPILVRPAVCISSGGGNGGGGGGTTHTSKNTANTINTTTTTTNTTSINTHGGGGWCVAPCTRLMHVFQEARCFDRLGLTLPSAVHAAVLREKAVYSARQELEGVVVLYAQVGVRMGGWGGWKGVAQGYFVYFLHLYRFGCCKHICTKTCTPSHTLQYHQYHYTTLSSTTMFPTTSPPPHPHHHIPTTTSPPTQLHTRLSPIEQQALSPQLATLEAVLSRGATSVTWGCLGLPGYVRECQQVRLVWVQGVCIPAWHQVWLYVGYIYNVCCC